MLVKEKVTREEAANRCRHYGAYLAKPMDNWTNQYLKEHLRKLTKESVWFGLHKYKDGWKHIDGKLLGNGYQDWGPGQPDNSKGIEFCGHFWNAINYKWNDAPCNFKYHFLCQTDRC